MKIILLLIQRFKINYLINFILYLVYVFDKYIKKFNNKSKKMNHCLINKKNKIVILKTNSKSCFNPIIYANFKIKILTKKNIIKLQKKKNFKKFYKFIANVLLFFF